MGRWRPTGCGRVPAAGRAQPSGLGVCGEGGAGRGVLGVGSDPLGAPSRLRLWGGAVGRGTSVVGFSQWGLFACGSLGLRVLGSAGRRMSIARLPNGVSPLVGGEHSPRCGVALWGVGEH